MNAGPLDVSRRAFVLAGATVLLSARAARGERRDITAQQVVDRIRASVGVPWRDTTVDTFKSGDPNTVVTGIATTVMATLGVLRQAAAAGRNLIIAYEPTFYAGNDNPGTRATEPVHLAKKAFIDEHHLVVWRFSDHWLARKPNELTRALAETLGWTAGRTADSESIYTVPPTTLRRLAAHVRSRLGVRGGMRVIGKADSPIRRVAISPGTTDLPTAVQTLQHADLIVSGEPREWEAVEYVWDTAFARQPKNMIAVGRLVSEEPGMRACAAWLRTLVPEVPVEAIAVGDPYWRPAL
jgi:putative NIF3 family GTP cyclohydrolase 1 type 2